MEAKILNKHRETTNNQRYLCMDVWRRGIATEEQAEIAWYAMLYTIESKASKHYNQKITEGNEERAMLLSHYLAENTDKPVRLLIYNYRRLFPTFELMLELYGLDTLTNNTVPVTKFANQNKFYYMRQVAQLQRAHQCWHPETLTQLWLTEISPEQRRTNAVSQYRLRTIREMSEEIINARRKQREYPESQISDKERRIAGF